MNAIKNFINNVCISIALFTVSTTIMAEAGLDNSKNLSIPVIIDAENEAELSSPITGFINKIDFKSGNSFKKDDVLIEYDCTVLKSELKQAEAAVENLSVKSASMNKLFKLDGASHVEVTEAKQQLTEAMQEKNIKSHLVKQCIIQAPFNGQVVELHVNNHEYIERGEPLIDIVNPENLELKLIVPSEWLSWVKIGTKFEVIIFETNKSYPAKITRVVYKVDHVSNTFVAYATILDDTKNIKPGMSGVASFHHEEIK